MRRFQNRKQLMAYLGLIPSEHSSGKTVRRGPITKTGNSHVRRVLIEAAWTYKVQARVSNILLKRQKELPKSIRDIYWKAQTRLCARYRQLYARGKSRQTVVIENARELSAFIWATDKEIQLTVLWYDFNQFLWSVVTAERRTLIPVMGIWNSRS